jgi:hypothetical protein
MPFKRHIIFLTNAIKADIAQKVLSSFRDFIFFQKINRTKSKMFSSICKTSYPEYFGYFREMMHLCIISDHLRISGGPFLTWSKNHAGLSCNEVGVSSLNILPTNMNLQTNLFHNIIYLKKKSET